MGQHDLFELASGRIVRTVRLGKDLRQTAGVGQRCGGRVVAVYVEGPERRLVLQVDADRFPLDGRTDVRHRVLSRGMRSELTVLRADSPMRTVHQRTIAKVLLGKVDPAYDALDASLDDFLAEVADIASSERRREWLREIKDPPSRAVGPGALTIASEGRAAGSDDSSYAVSGLRG